MLWPFGQDPLERAIEEGAPVALIHVVRRYVAEYKDRPDGGTLVNGVDLTRVPDVADPPAVIPTLEAPVNAVVGLFAAQASLVGRVVGLESGIHDLGSAHQESSPDPATHRSGTFSCRNPRTRLS